MDPTKVPGCHLTLEWTEKETEDERELVGEEQTQGIHSKRQLWNYQEYCHYTMYVCDTCCTEYSHRPKGYRRNPRCPV